MAVDRLSLTFGALADPTRRAILARLAKGGASVTELAEPFDMSLPAVSKHLKVLERVFDASRERVFDVLTKSEHLQKWFGPKMVGHPVAEFEARPGGRIFIGESHSDGATLYLAGGVREIERPSRLVFAFHFANEKGERVSPPAGSGLPAGWEGEMVTTVTLRAEGLRTRVIVTAHKTDVTAEWLAKARYGWGESLDKLGYAIADDMKVTSNREREIVITRPFNAPRAIVYEALTKAEHVKNW